MKLLKLVKISSEDCGLQSHHVEQPIVGAAVTVLRASHSSLNLGIPRWFLMWVLEHKFINLIKYISLQLFEW